MEWTHDTKEKINYTLAGLMIAFGMALTAVSAFAIDPLGEVHSSIITLFGLSISFAGALIGINAHYSNELTNFKIKTKEYVDSEIDRRSNKHHSKENEHLADIHVGNQEENDADDQEV